MAAASARSGETIEPRSVRIPLAAILFGGTAFVVLHNWLGFGGAALDGVADGQLGAIVIAAAGVACLLRAHAVPRERRAWLLIGLGVLGWAAGESYWVLFIVDNPNPPYPSFADALYLSFYPLCYAGLAMLVRARAHELDWRLWMDGLIAALGTAALGAAFVFDFVADRTRGTAVEVAVSLAYPLADIAMIAIVVGVIALSGWRPDRTWGLLLAGLAAMVVADIAYSIQSSGGVVPPGNWIDPLYLVSASFLGAVLWLPRAAAIQTSERVDDRRALMVPTLFAAMMIGLAAMQYLGGTSGLSTTLWAATMAAVIVRLAVSVRENRRLLEQVRTDSLTGLGNRGGMQLDLEGLCARAGEGEPAALYLFDLNGFKRYNDSFGHLAGDELLTLLGGRLRDALAGKGTAYRIGGDEFCALLTCRGRRFDDVAREAAAALAASDHGVEVGCSWGGASIPVEAADPATALQLADVRMYAQKEARRGARGDRGAVKVPPWPQTSGTK
ncbi:MAG: GGDEF domain-containing protein [Solirubrobacterales bacterium]